MVSENGAPPPASSDTSGGVRAASGGGASRQAGVYRVESYKERMRQASLRRQASGYGSGSSSGSGSPNGSGELLPGARNHFNGGGDTAQQRVQKKQRKERRNRRGNAAAANPITYAGDYDSKSHSTVNRRNNFSKRENRAISQLSERIIRVMALNPSVWTLDGTCTYLIGKGLKRILIDTGEGGTTEYVKNLKRALLSSAATKVEAVLLTHSHHDHIGGLQGTTLAYKYQRQQTCVDTHTHTRTRTHARAHTHIRTHHWCWLVHVIVNLPCVRGSIYTRTHIYANLVY